MTFGATVSYITMSLYSGFSANAFSIDIATQYVSDFRGFRFGMQIANFGSEIQYVHESYPLPTNITFGLAMNAVESEQQKFLVSMSAIKPNEGEPLGQIGGEWNYEELLFLRGGYRINNTVATYSFGAGVHVAVSSYGVRADYSYSNFRVLGAAHRFEVGLSF